MYYWEKFKLSNRLIIICLSELVGTFLLVFFGDSAVAQTIFYSGSNLSIGIGWAVGLFTANLLADKIFSHGLGHFNPAVTVAYFLTHGYKHKKAVPFATYVAVIFCQLLGGFLAAVFVYLQYFDVWRAVDPARKNPQFYARVFTTFPEYPMTVLGSLGVEIMATSMLMVAWYACLHQSNNFPIYTLPLVYLGISQSFGAQTGFALNPARDFAPRLFAEIVYPYKDVWNFPSYTGRSNYYEKQDMAYFWIPIVGPIIGAVVGAFVYIGTVGAHIDEDLVRSYQEDSPEFQVEKHVKDLRPKPTLTLTGYRVENNGSQSQEYEMPR